MQRRLFLYMTVLILACSLLLPASAATNLVIPSRKAAGRLEVSMDSRITGMTAQDILLKTPGEGVCRLTVADPDGVNRDVWEVQVPPGTSAVAWNGCARWGQPLYPGKYTLKASLRLASGERAEAECGFEVKSNEQALLYAVPSSKTLRMLSGEAWYMEVGMVRGGQAVMDVFRPDGTRVLRTAQVIGKSGLGRIQWNGKDENGRYLTPGRYTVSVYAQGKEAEEVRQTIYLQDVGSEARSFGVTGPVLPRGGESGTELWNLMMQPSAVAQGDYNQLVEVRAEPRARSGAAGTVHALSQGLEVLGFEDGEEGLTWVRVRGFRQEDGAGFTGYLREDQMTVRVPDREYALLVDKKEQTLTVYREGVIIASVPVSTGLPVGGQTRYETVCGAFFVSGRTEKTDAGGETLDWQLRYDGARCLSQTGYTRRNGVCHLTGEEQLGKKSSRGSILVGAGAQWEISSFWLCAHIPNGTRVLVTGDQEEEAVPRMEAGEDTAEWMEEIRLTAAGLVNPGQTEDAWAEGRTDRKDLSEALREMSLSDDLTLADLGCVLTDDGEDAASGRPDIFRAGEDAAETLRLDGMDLLSLNSVRTADYRYHGLKSTCGALEASGLSALSEGNGVMLEIRGKKLAFVKVTEATYALDRRAGPMQVRKWKEKGCDALIAVCEWGNPLGHTHTRLQESMAADLAGEGADLIVGLGPAVQGVGSVLGVPVIWSLGKLLDGEMEALAYGCVAEIVLGFDREGLAGFRVALVPTREKDGTAGEAEGAEADMVRAWIQADSDRPAGGSMVFVRER